MLTQDFTAQTKALIDALKSVCTSYGLGNDGNEFKIITQVFLYKFMNDKFSHDIKQLAPALQHAANWEQAIAAYADDDYEMLLLQMPADSAKLKREHYLSNLHNRQNEAEFAKLFDDTLREIAIFNSDIFSVKTGTGAKIILFDELSNYITDSSQRDNFCRAIINPLVNFSFENVFHQKFDFFAAIFEYLIKDYNKDGGGKYAEYFTPHAVAKIMAAILVDAPVRNVTCYDPAAGSGTLLMSLAHAIGEDRCAIYSQDISQKSSGMLRLNLILNNLVHSIQNIIQGNTLLTPYHKVGEQLMAFDYIVSNPPFKLDFSDYRNDLDAKARRDRFFAGVPNIPNKDKRLKWILFGQCFYQLHIDATLDYLIFNGLDALRALGVMRPHFM
jgi:type I restriction enzyme M protein